MTLIYFVTGKWQDLWCEKSSIYISTYIHCCMIALLCYHSVIYLVLCSIVCVSRHMCGMYMIYTVSQKNVQTLKRYSSKL